MGSNLFLILLLVSAIWQVVGSMAEKKAKQKQQEELARRRAEAQSRGGSPASSPPDVRVQSPGGMTVPTSARSRAEEIAARRKAQIEELRRRAAERSGGGGGSRQTADASIPTVGRPDRSSSAAAAGRAKIASTGRTSAPVNQSRRPEIARDFEELTRRRESERAAKAIDVQRNDERDAMERRRREVEGKARQAKAARDEAALQRDAARARTMASTGGLLGSTMAGTGVGTGSSANRLRALAGNRQAMRDAILLREIIDAPVALRSSPMPIDGATGLGG
jgi:hypothetical protein